MLADLRVVALRATVLEVLTSVNDASIRGPHRLALRAVDASSAGAHYGAAESKQHSMYINRIGRWKERCRWS